jgi:hypothetical protein
LRGCLDLHRPDAWDIGSRLYPLSSCIFDAALYVIVAEEEMHNFLLFLMNMEYNASVCGGCCGFVALNDLCLVLLLDNSLLGEGGLC